MDNPYTGNESTRLARTIRRIDKNIKIAYKTNNKLNNIISNKIEQYKKYDMHQLQQILYRKNQQKLQHNI